MKKLVVIAITFMLIFIASAWTKDSEIEVEFEPVQPGPGDKIEIVFNTAHFGGEIGEEDSCNVKMTVINGLDEPATITRLSMKDPQNSDFHFDADDLDRLTTAAPIEPGETRVFQIKLIKNGACEAGDYKIPVEIVGTH